MILGPDGEKLSKRHGAVNVMEYDKEGYLPEAMLNYLARLGWSHGNDEIFTREDLVEWFDTRNLSKSAAQWDPKKLNWVNAHYIKNSDDAELAKLVAPRILLQHGDPQAVDLTAVMSLLKDRAETLNQLAHGAMLFCGPYVPASAELRAEHLDDQAIALLSDFRQQAEALSGWDSASLDDLIKSILTKHGVKMPKLGLPLRLAVTGQKQTPAIGAVLAILGRELVLERLAAL
jgi:glutamyl-tRNA synthetase